MLEKKFEKLNKAYEDYNLDEREEISLKILNYIRYRLEKNEEFIKSLSKTTKDISYSRVLEIFEEANSEAELYKKEKVVKKLEDGFMYGIYTTSVGNIAVECDSTIDVIRYFVYAIKSRNTITISDLEYLENDLKHALLLIFQESMQKYDIDPNLINIMPYEECYYDNFDLIIDVEENGIQKKNQSSKLYIYQATEKFEEEIKKETEYLEKYNREYEIVSGDFYETIKKINETIPSGAAIYTENAEEGYKFINLIHSKNVFVNTSFAELDENIKDVSNVLYMKKKIMYPN